jgi:hypothetical protein
VLRELAEAKNAVFRRSLIGCESTAVTLDPPGLALTDNYIKATLDLPYTPNRLVRLQLRGITDHGVSARVMSEI